MPDPTSLRVIKLPIAQANFSSGRFGANVDKIFIHLMVGNMASATARFSNPSQLVSATYGVEEDVIGQWVSEEDTSYNCGVWEFNTESISIEHSGMPGDVHSDTLYQTSSTLLRDICNRWGLSPIDNNLVLPHRKVFPTACPDDLDIDRIIAGANAVPDDSIATLLRTDANDIVTLASVLIDQIQANPNLTDHDKAAMGFEAAEVKRKMGATETRYTNNVN